MVMTSWQQPVAPGARLPALWRCIEDAHYVYLDIDDSPEKLQQKKKLEGYIMEYLSLVPHECKFGLAETGKVFERTIAELVDFSAYRAGLGWAALGRYASNLLSQPWRKEYRTIRLYCGYFKHEVEANMVGAEMLLQQMGYKADGVGRMSLDSPICPDMVAAISRDALIAHVECQMMAQVWEAVWGTGRRVSWSDVARERGRHVGDVAGAAARLAGQLAEAPPDLRNYADDADVYSNVPVTVSQTTQSYHHQQRLLELSRHLPCSHMYSPEETPIEQPIVPMVHPSTFMVPPHMNPQNMMYNVPAHLQSEIPVMAPFNTIPVTTPYGVMPYYYPGVQTPYMIPTPVYAPIKQASTVPINGCPSIHQYRYPPVPTGQLIEFDGPSSCENGFKIREDVSRMHRDVEDRNVSRKSRAQYDTCARNSTSKSGFSDVSLPSITRSDTQPTLSKAREDGMGTYESWDYVFRNLSSKQHDEDRSRISPSLDRDSRTLDRLDREERRVKYHPTTLDLEDGLLALNLDRSYDEEAYRTAKVNENLMKIKQENELKRARHLAKKQASEEKVKKKHEPIGNPESDGLINTRVAPDKIRLLTKKDVKDRKDIIKQQHSSLNGSSKLTLLDGKKLKKTSKAIINDVDKLKSKPVLENGHSNTYSAKTVPGSSNASLHSSNHSYDAKTHLIVSLDETDSMRRSPSKSQHNGESERTSSGNSSRQNGTIETRPNCESLQGKSTKWQCSTCTYINNSAKAVCDMCGKSKNVGVEVMPLTSGGRECPACTLVNNKDASICDACGNDLKHCPTYI